MSQVDPKRRFSMAVIGALSSTELDRGRAFFDSEDYQRQILPLLNMVETKLKDSWRRFNSSNVASLPLLDFGNQSPITSNPTEFGRAETPLTTPCDQGSSLQMSQSEVDEPPRGARLHDAAGGSAASVPTSPVDLQGRETPDLPAAPTAPVAGVPSMGPPPVTPVALTSLAGPTTKPVLPRSKTVEFMLPNASEGLAYAQELLPTRPVPGLIIQEVRTSEHIGLHFDPSTGRLQGTPNKAGEFEFDICFHTSNQKQELASARLIVNPDPKSLWKTLPSDQSDPYWKPDEDQQFIKGSDGWSLVAGSKRGRSHAQKGTFRDDDFFIFSQEHSGWQIAVVSDGAGSAKFSRRGSAIICKDGGEHLERALAGEAGGKLSELVEAWQESRKLAADEDTQQRLIKTQLYVTLGYAAHFALTRIREECERRSDLGGVAKDYSSTVLIGITKRFPFGVFCASFSIGDGAIGVMHADGKPELLCEPDGGDFSGQTRFLSQETVTQEELLKRLKFSLISDFQGFYLMTDGISDPYFQTDKGLEMPERWAQLLHDVETEASLSQRHSESGPRLVSWLDFWSKGEHDDRTLAVIF